VKRGKREDREQAVALKYRPGQDRAPRVVASGQGELARRILDVARSEGIPVVEDRDLAQILSVLDIDREIPPDLYRAVAEVLAFVYRLNRRRTASAPSSPEGGTV